MAKKLSTLKSFVVVKKQKEPIGNQNYQHWINMAPSNIARLLCCVFAFASIGLGCGRGDCKSIHASCYSKMNPTQLTRLNKLRIGSRVPVFGARECVARARSFAHSLDHGRVHSLATLFDCLASVESWQLVAVMSGRIWFCIPTVRMMHDACAQSDSKEGNVELKSYYSHLPIMGSANSSPD